MISLIDCNKKVFRAEVVQKNLNCYSNKKNISLFNYFNIY